MKKGLSDVVVTVLIILIVLAAIGIISAILFPLLRNSGKEVGTEKFTTNIQIVPKFTGGDPCVVEFDINRPAGQGNITALRFILTNSSGRTKTVDYPSAPSIPPFTFGELEIKHIMLNCSPLNNVVSVSVAPIFSGGSVGLIADTQPVPSAVCGNSVVEVGEQCDGGPGLCHTGPGNLFLGRADCGALGSPNQCKLVGVCNQNKQCSDGFDDDSEGGCDFRQYTTTCAPWPSSDPRSNLFGDLGCASSEDDDETREEMVVLRPSETDYNTIQLPYMMTVEFNIIDPESASSIAPINGGAQCWYKLDNGVEQSLGTCNNYGHYQPAQQISVPVAGQHTITLGIRDSGSGLDHDEKTINFNLVQSSLLITSPTEDQIVPVGTVPFTFSLGQNFHPTTCSYQINQQPAQSFACPSGNSGAGTLPSLTHGSYSLSLFANTAAIQTQDVINFVVNTCPGDLNNDRVIDFLDLNGMLSAIGCQGTCNSGWSCPASPCEANINYDESVDTIDLALFLNRFGTNC